MSLEVMKQALEALEQVKPLYTKQHAIAALRQAIEQAEKRQWIDLTSDEIWEVYKKHDSMQYMAFARAIEQSLKEKNSQ